MAVTSIVSTSEKCKFIESVFGRGRLSRDGKNFDVRCPVCASSDRTKLKLSFLVPNDVGHCWVCGEHGSLWKFIRNFGSKEDLLEYREKFLPKDGSVRHVWSDDEKPKQALKLPDGFKMLAMCMSSLEPDVRAALKYCLKRNLTEADLWRYRLGIAPSFGWKRRIIIPSFDVDGKLNYYVGRAIDQGRRPKYENPDVNRADVIFNEIDVDWKQRVTLCEGPFDMFKCGENTIPLLGSDISVKSALFNAIVANDAHVALALDGDMWNTKLVKLTKLFTSYNVKVDVVDTRSFEDPATVTKEAFSEVLNVAKPLDWRDVFRSKLHRASRVKMHP